MSSYTLTITHPSRLNTDAVPVLVYRQVVASGISLPAMGDNPRTLTFDLSDHYDVFSNPADATNPLTWGSYVVLTRTTSAGTQTIFEGTVATIEDSLSGGAPSSLSISCVSIEAALHHTLADGGNTLNYEIVAPVISLTGLVLYKLTGVAGYSSDVLYPVYPGFSTATNTPSSSSPWVARSKSRSTTIGQDMTNVATTAFKVADDRELTAPGFLQIGTELLHYSQAWKDAAGQSWVGGTIVRGVLGSTNAAHTNGDACYQRVLKPICDSAPMTLRYGGSAQIVPRDKYHPRPSEGRFDFNRDFSYYSSSSDCDISFYDIDAAGAYTAAELITLWLEAGVAYGGPEIAAGDIDTSGLDEILLGRQVIDAANGQTNTWACIWALIDEVWNSCVSGTARKHMFFYSALNGKWTAKTIRQGLSATATFLHATQKTSSYSMSQLYQAALVSYDVSEPVALLDSDRVYHLAIGDAASYLTAGATTASLVTDIMYMYSDRANAGGWQESAGASHNQSTELMLDGVPTTGWGLRFNEIFWTSGEDPTIICCLWFPNATPQSVDYVELVFDARRFIPTYYEIDVVGLSSYVVGDPPTIGSIVPLGIHYRVGNYSAAGPSGKPHHWVRNTRGSE